MSTDQTNAPFINQALPEPLPADPFPLLLAWLKDAHDRRVQPNPNAMAFATVDPDGSPSARILLCKAVDPVQGFLVFYTNYNSRKGRALDAHPQGAAVFHWDTLDRQVRIEGPITRSSPDESDAYFASRPVLSRASAWASEQSRPIASRAAMLARLQAAEERFGLDPAEPLKNKPETRIPRPPHWGGYRLWARRVELWVGGIGRFHDRAEWTRSLPQPPDADQTQAAPGGPAWKCTRLQP